MTALILAGLQDKRLSHPHSNVFPAIMVETQYLRRDQQGLGLNLSLSNVGETFGYHARWGNLLVQIRKPLPQSFCLLLQSPPYLAISDRPHAQLQPGLPPRCTGPDR